MKAPGPQLLVASRNRKKAAEIARLLAGLPLVLVTPAEAGDLPEIPEGGESFRENARAKARGYARAAGMWALADDSGLEVDALGGRPGVRSARYAGLGAGDEANLALLLREMAGVPAGRRGARFRCWAVLAAPEGIVAEAEGVCEGRIAAAPAGGGGFGYDPVFLVDGAGRTMAELADGEKDEVSHRGRALRALRPELERRLAGAGGRA